MNALPRDVWISLGYLELHCVLGLILPGVMRWRPTLTVVAASILVLETIVFVGVHIKYREVGPIIMSALLGLVMAFIAYGRATHG